MKTLRKLSGILSGHLKAWANKERERAAYATWGKWERVRAMLRGSGYRCGSYCSQDGSRGPMMEHWSNGGEVVRVTYYRKRVELELMEGGDNE